MTEKLQKRLGELCAQRDQLQAQLQRLQQGLQQGTAQLNAVLGAIAVIEELRQESEAPAPDDPPPSANRASRRRAARRLKAFLNGHDAEKAAEA